VFVEDISKGFLAYCLHLSRFAIDTSIVDYIAVQGGQNSRRLSLDGVPTEFTSQPFVKLFVFFLKNRGKVAIGIFRRGTPAAQRQDGSEDFFDESGSDIVISCPPKSLVVQRDDRIYTISSSVRRAEVR